jgi:hypothetical protein
MIKTFLLVIAQDELKVKKQLNYVYTSCTFKLFFA